MLNEDEKRKTDIREFPYSGVPTFYKYPHTSDLTDVDVAMLGVPLDLGTTYRPGTRIGPRAIREASQIYGIIQLFKEAYDIEMGITTLKNLKVVDYGDVPIIPTLTKVNRNLIRESIERILKNQFFPVVFGADHSITFPIVKAYQKELDVVHFDSHLDFTDDYGDGLRYTHGNPLKRILELENVDKITQIGIRGLLNPKTAQKEAQKYGANIIVAGKALKHGNGS